MTGLLALFLDTQKLEHLATFLRLQHLYTSAIIWWRITKEEYTLMLKMDIYSTSTSCIMTGLLTQLGAKWWLIPVELQLWCQINGRLFHYLIVMIF
jgi:hypothetical protein